MHDDLALGLGPDAEVPLPGDDLAIGIRARRTVEDHLLAEPGLAVSACIRAWREVEPELVRPHVGYWGTIEVAVDGALCAGVVSGQAVDHRGRVDERRLLEEAQVHREHRLRERDEAVEGPAAAAEVVRGEVVRVHPPPPAFGLAPGRVALEFAAPPTAEVGPLGLEQVVHPMRAVLEDGAIHRPVDVHPREDRPVGVSHLATAQGRTTGEIAPREAADRLDRLEPVRLQILAERLSPFRDHEDGIGVGHEPRVDGEVPRERRRPVRRSG